MYTHDNLLYYNIMITNNSNSYKQQNLYNNITINNKKEIWLHKKQQNLYNKNYNKNDKVSYTRFNIPLNKEWYDSVYSFNKNSIKLLPFHNNYTRRISKSYFNLFNFNFNVKNRGIKKFFIRSKKLSANKMFLSKPGIKHRNSELLLNLDLFNAHYKFIFNKLAKSNDKIKILFKLNKEIILLKKRFYYYNNIIKSFFFKNEKYFSLNDEQIINKILDSRKILQLKIYSSIMKRKKIIFSLNKPFKKRLKRISRRLYYFYFFLKEDIIKNKNINNSLAESLSDTFFDFSVLNYKSFYFKQLIKLNLSKFNYENIFLLNTILKKIYNKQVKTNITNLKYFFLNSNIMAELILNKIKERKKKPSRIVKRSISRIKMPWFNKFDTINYLIKPYRKSLFNKFNKTNLLFLFNYKNKKDVMNELLTEIFKDKINYLENINIKSIRGIKVKASGRLTRRAIASRSISIERQIGGFKNTDSSFKGLSSDMARGSLHQNIQYTNLNSNVRNGSFGVKIWINS